MKPSKLYVCSHSPQMLPPPQPQLRRRASSLRSVRTLILTHPQEINGAIQEMDRNVRQLKAREERLDSLQNKTDNLAQSAQGFRRGANKVRKQMWWKDMKMRMCLIVGIIILLVIIIVPSGESLRVPNLY
jgi:hypothetical protein